MRDRAARELSTQVLQSASVLTQLNAMVAELDVYAALSNHNSRFD
jgi:hypothetical protein